MYLLIEISKNNFTQNKKPSIRMKGFLLSDQGSNLDSSEPKPDVLPVTPSDKGSLKGMAKIEKKFICKKLHR